MVVSQDLVMCSLGWLRTHYAAHASLELVILEPQDSSALIKCFVIAAVCHLGIPKGSYVRGMICRVELLGSGRTLKRYDLIGLWVTGCIFLRGTMES